MTPIPQQTSSSARLRASRALGAAFMAAVVAGSALSSLPPLAHAAQHIVAPGETLTAIASRYGLPVETLMDVNGIADPNAIHEGDVLIIPEFAGSAPIPDAGRFHTVVPGDTLSGLADLYGVSVDDIAVANGIFDPTGVHLGATLIIPGSMAPSPADTEVVAPAPAAAASGIRHTVEAGEILSAIAGTYGVRLEALVAANGLANPNAIFPGQILVVPGANREGPALVETTAVVHVVLPGDTLSSIADRYGVALSRLADANNLADHDIIVVGERIVIPGAGTPSQITGYSQVLHLVEPGETLSSIANRYGVALGEIASANQIANLNLVVVGQSLTIPGGGPGVAASAIPVAAAAQTHIVQPGETLAAIALRYGVSQSSIIEANGISNPNIIVEGRALSVPGGTAGAVASRGYSLAEYEVILENAAAEFGISAALLKALAWQESGWNQFVESHAGAVGLMQVTPWTADWALLTLTPDATDWETNAVSNARMGAAILHHWLVRSDWDTSIALASYYQGWRAVQEFGMYDETVVYVNNVLSLIPQFE